MKILVLAETYPMPGGKVTPMYIHMRNKYYALQGADVTVLNFSAKEQASYEGIPIITWSGFDRLPDKGVFDLLVLHASNIKHHYRFLQKYGSFFKHYVFVFHGHEVLRKRAVYPPLYPWKRQSNRLSLLCRDTYDRLKLVLWRRFFENPANVEKSELLFVSGWMEEQFLRNTGLSKDKLAGRMHIIYNSVGKLFEANRYEPKSIKYDFVTIRRNIDGEKYCVDVVNALAKANSEYKFLVVGRGSLFEHIEKAANLVWDDRNLYHGEMFDVLNQCRFALMPTKTDAQGLMMCEMATYGIPVVTSDIDVCHEVLDDFSNVAFISNTGKDRLGPIVKRFEESAAIPHQDKYFERNTSGQEYRLFVKIMQSDR